MRGREKVAGGFHIGMEEGDPGPPNAIEITVRVDDAVATFRRLVVSGVNVEGPPQDQLWGTRHAWFRERDGDVCRSIRDALSLL